MNLVNGIQGRSTVLIIRFLVEFAITLRFGVSKFMIEVLLIIFIIDGSLFVLVLLDIFFFLFLSSNLEGLRAKMQHGLHEVTCSLTNCLVHDPRLK